MRSFWTVWKSTRHLSSIVELSLSILHTLFSLDSENASTHRACPPTKHEKSISGSRHGMRSSHQGCWAPVLLSLEVRAHLELGVQPGPLTLERWPLCFTMDAGVNRQCSGSYFFTDCPTGLSWSLASGWIQFTGSVGETEEQEEGKIRTSTLSLLLRVWSVAASSYCRVSLPRFYWHWELSRSLLWGLVLCIAGYFTLASVP